MFLNLIALTMICDMNRVIMMLYPGYVTFNWDGIMHTHEHHGLSHRTGDFTVGGACGVDGVLDMIWQIDKWYAGKYAKLVGLLDSISEGGGKLLDNTATMWLPELSDGAAHNLNNLPIVIAGSAGGYLKTGQVVNVETSGTPQAGNSEQLLHDSGGTHRQHRLERRQRADQQALRDADERGRLHRDRHARRRQGDDVRPVRRHGLVGRHHQPRRGHEAHRRRADGRR